MWHAAHRAGLRIGRDQVGRLMRIESSWVQERLLIKQGDWSHGSTSEVR